MTVSVFFYVQHLLGIGHLARAALVAEALADHGAKVTLATGGRPVPGLPGANVKGVQLPPVAAGPGGFSDLVDVDGKPIDEDFRRRRSELLSRSLIEAAPDVIVIEAFPFGRRQMRFELLPLLDTAGSLPRRPVVACSVRDILQSRSPEKQRETVQLIAQHFDLVLVHGDDQLVSLDQTFPLAPELQARIEHTGIVSGGQGDLDNAPYDVVVSAGGGVAGARLMRSALAARRACTLSGARWCLLTGPNLDKTVVEELRAGSGTGLSVYERRSDFRALLTQAQLSISQAGYNTVADVLKAGCRSVLVPFAAEGETEQTFRANRLAERGLVTLIEEDDLSGDSLALAVDACMRRPPIGVEHGINLSGADNSAQVLLAHAASRGAVSS